MMALSIALAALQVLMVLVGAPLVIGAMRQVRARLEGRRGGGLGQPWRDLRKLFRKQQITPEGTTVVFRAAPFILLGSTLLIAAIIPVVSLGSPLDSSGDFVAVVGLLFLGTVALALAALDTGTAFGGMGSSRQMTVVALVEPTILLVLFTLSLRVHSANLAEIAGGTLANPAQAFSLGRILAFASLVIVIIAETGRLPVDNPATHLELTMIHEAMTLEYAGPRLGLVEWASGMRLTVLLVLLANLFFPWGVAPGEPGLIQILIAVAAIAAKVAILAMALSVGETFLAKLRLFRVPELLAGSFLLGILAVTASSFLPAASR